MRQAQLEEIAQRDGRYAYEAYEFLFEALEHTLLLGGKAPPAATVREPERGCHVSGRELLDGICDLAVRQFGLLARIVFRMWGIERTDDFGAIVFRLVEAGLMSKTDDDSLQDFESVYELDDVLVKDFRIELEEGTEA
jgi:uncharacterized repeat protein (TIGR04138 family)